jgi:hypothetical protein
LAKNDEYTQLVVEAFDLAAEARKPHEKKWDEYYKLSRGVVGKKSKKWMTNYFVPYTPAILDIVASRLAAQRLRGKITGENEDSQTRAPLFDQFIDSLQRDMNIEYLQAVWIYEMCRYGTAFLKLGWRREKAEHLKRSKGFIDRAIKYFMNLGQEVKEEDFLYDGPTVEQVDIYDLFFHPQARSVSESRFVIHRREMSKDEILKNPNFNKNMDAVKKLKASSEEIGKYRKKRLQAAGLTPAQQKRVSASMGDDYFEVLEYRGMYDIDKDGADEEVVISVVNRNICVQFEENPYYLVDEIFVPVRYKVDPTSIYGVSLLEVLKEPQYMLNDIANQAGDMRKLTLQPVIKFKPSAKLDAEDIKIVPGLPIPTEDTNDLVFERPPDFTSQLEFLSRSTRQIMQIASGVNDVSIGVQDAGMVTADTLGGLEIAEQQTALRYRLPQVNIDSAMKEFGNKLIALVQQFYDREKEVKIFGPKGIEYQKIAPFQLMGKFSYRMDVQSTGLQSRLTRQSAAIKIKEMYAGDETKNQEQIDREVLESMGFDAERFMNPQGGGLQIDKVQEMLATKTPEQIEQYLGRLRPQDRMLMEKAMAAAAGEREVPGAADIEPAQSPGNQGAPQV